MCKLSFVAGVETNRTYWTYAKPWHDECKTITEDALTWSAFANTNPSTSVMRDTAATALFSIAQTLPPGLPSSLIEGEALKGVGHSKLRAAVQSPDGRLFDNEVTWLGAIDSYRRPGNNETLVAAEAKAWPSNATDALLPCYCRNWLVHAKAAL